MESHGALLYDQPGTNQYIALQSLEIIYFEKMNLIVLYFIIFFMFRLYTIYIYIWVRFIPLSKTNPWKTMKQINCKSFIYFDWLQFLDQEDEQDGQAWHLRGAPRNR